MIPPGLLVAFTLASTPPASMDGRMGAASGSPPRAHVPGDRAEADGVDATTAAAGLLVGREPEPARFADLLLAMVSEGRSEALAAPLADTPAGDELVAHRVASSEEDASEGEAAAELVAVAVPVALPLSPVLAEPLPMVTLEGTPSTLEPAAIPGPAAPPAAALALAVPATPQVVGGSQGGSTLDPSTLRGLERDFARRLTRVAERLQSEYGRTLEVVEGLRSQARQNELFNQGRTDVGPIVTWTTESLHTIGRAADVWVDGAPVTPESALLLARIAREEGLRTLYPIDSGHIQVEGSGDGSPEAPLPRRADAPAVGGPAPRKGVAPVAPVAPVAKPARAGGVVTRDGALSPAGGSDSTPGAAGPESSAALFESSRAPAHSSDGRTPPVVAGVTAPAPGRTGSMPDSGSVAASPPLDPGRFEAAGAPPAYRSVRLPLEGFGEGSSLHVGLRGSIVDARLSIADPLVAADLSRGIRELGQQLGLKGLDVGDVAVRLVPDVMADTSRPLPSLVAPHDLRPSYGGAASTGGSSADPGSQQGRSSNTTQDPLDGRERGSRQRKDPTEDQAS